MCSFFNKQNEHFMDVWPVFWRTPFYAAKLKQARIHPDDVTGLQDIKKIPFTYKNEVRLTSPFERTPLSIEEIRLLLSSSGTTGRATVYAWGDEDIEILRESGRKAFTDIGVQEADVVLVLAPFGMPVMGYCMLEQYRELGVTVIPLGVRPPQEVLHILNEWPITAIATLPTVAVKLYEFAVLNEVRLPDRKISFHFGGHFMSNALRKRIESMWGGKAYNLFGMSEIFGPIGWECEQQEGFHYIAEHLYVEVIDPDTLQPVEPGEIGVAIYTTLWNKGFPLLRYWSDDFVVMISNPCSCGSPLPRFRYVGRPHEMTVVNGRRIFSSQVEEIVLSYPVGNEYRLKFESTHREDKAVLVVEMPSLKQSVVNALSDLLSQYLQIPVEVEVVTPGSLNRDYVKPVRIIDTRGKEK